MARILDLRRARLAREAAERGVPPPRYPPPSYLDFDPLAELVRFGRPAR